MKYKLAATLLVIGSIILLVLAAKTVLSLAHFHLDWVCEVGIELITDETDKLLAQKFTDYCLAAEEKWKEIFNSAINIAIYSIGFATIPFYIGLKLYDANTKNT